MPVSQEFAYFIRALERQQVPGVIDYIKRCVGNVIGEVAITIDRGYDDVAAAQNPRRHADIRQHVAAIGRRVSTLCKSEEGLCQQLALYHCYYNFCYFSFFYN